jgi:hypothetical protein
MAEKGVHSARCHLKAQAAWLAARRTVLELSNAHCSSSAWREVHLSRDFELKKEDFANAMRIHGVLRKLDC